MVLAYWAEGNQFPYFQQIGAVFKSSLWPIGYPKVSENSKFSCLMSWAKICLSEEFNITFY